MIESLSEDNVIIIESWCAYKTILMDLHLRKKLGVDTKSKYNTELEYTLMQKLPNLTCYILFKYNLLYLVEQVVVYLISNNISSFVYQDHDEWKFKAFKTFVHHKIYTAST